MQRLTLVLLMTFAMLWQAVAMARVGSTVNALADMDHAVLHWQDASHHHHEDGSYHMDETNESVRHVVTDHAGATLALAALPSLEFAPLGSAAPAGRPVTRVPDPTLAGLLRPPRARS